MIWNNYFVQAGTSKTWPFFICSDSFIYNYIYIAVSWLHYLSNPENGIIQPAITYRQWYKEKDSLKDELIQLSSAEASLPQQQKNMKRKKDEALYATHFHQQIVKWICMLITTCTLYMSSVSFLSKLCLHVDCWNKFN